MKVYAGIGSRSTPAAVLDDMSRLAARLGLAGWHLRSGGAPGADKAFERGAADTATAEVFLPWPGFNGYPLAARSGGNLTLHNEPTAEAHRIAECHHPRWERLTRGVRRLHARNVHQVLGADCRTPAAFVVCWTPDGAERAEETGDKTGGTGQAIRVASAHYVAVVNMARSGWRERLEGLLCSP